METNSQLKAGEKGAWISIFAYIILATIKLTIGKIGHSEGLWADGLNNSTDIIASIAVLIGLKIARKPPDDNHLYGHYRAESIASLVAAFIMMSVGVNVIIGGVQSFFSQHSSHPDWITAWTALFSAMVMFGVYRYNLSLSRKIKSASIKAVAYDNRSDAFVSIGAFIGIVGTYIGIPLLDVVAAVIVGLIICRTAWHIFTEATHTLTDGFDQEQLLNIEKTIKETPGVLDVTDVKARTHGNYIFLETTIHVNPKLDVIESHRITEEIESLLKEKHEVENAFIHIEPFFDN
ncbi:cation diffusion facilitator family transporter [Bacillus sp. CGMCC 1.16607]|uniref:cation diffusion facilitator family transporter n=1 Tax=Bacillus sp. CGMCC 1.16607 TaxID=3351842 RepID=UPI003640BD34